jgi:hypothetical protein
VLGAGKPRREVAVVAAALLLPVPLLAATGVHLPLPAAVERGLASVTPGDGFAVPIREALSARPDSRQAEQSAVGSAQVASPGGEQASSSAFVGARAPARDVRDSDRPQVAGAEGGGVEPAEPQPPDTPPGDSPREDSPDSSPPEAPPAEPDTPPATAAQAEAADLLAVGLDAGVVSTDVEADADGVEVTVSAGDVLPPTALPLPLPLP